MKSLIRDWTWNFNYSIIRWSRLYPAEPLRGSKFFWNQLFWFCLVWVRFLNLFPKCWVSYSVKKNFIIFTPFFLVKKWLWKIAGVATAIFHSFATPINTYKMMSTRVSIRTTWSVLLRTSILSVIFFLYYHNLYLLY